MEAKDTVMSDEKIIEVRNKGEAEMFMRDRKSQHEIILHPLREIAETQAEISFKAGWREASVEVGSIAFKKGIKAGIREVGEAGDNLLDDVYWRGKFSTGEIRQFWNQLKQKVEGK